MTLRTVIIIGLGLLAAGCKPTIAGHAVQPRLVLEAPSALGQPPDASTLLSIEWGTASDCPEVPPQVAASWNAVPLRLVAQPRVGTGFSGDAPPRESCFPPQWAAPPPAPAAEDVIELAGPDDGLEAAFPSPAATFELLDPADGVLNRAGPLTVSLRLELEPGAFPEARVWPPGPLTFYFPCPGLELEFAKEVESGRFTLRFRPGLAAAGTYTCTPVLHYEVKASRCNAKDCVLHYGGAPVRSLTDPERFVSFDLTLR